jgi:hypothetical protein
MYIKNKKIENHFTRHIHNQFRSLYGNCTLAVHLLLVKVLIAWKQVAIIRVINPYVWYVHSLDVYIKHQGGDQELPSVITREVLWHARGTLCN